MIDKAELMALTVKCENSIATMRALGLIVPREHQLATDALRLASEGGLAAGLETLREISALADYFANAPDSYASVAINVPKQRAMIVSALRLASRASDGQFAAGFEAGMKAAKEIADHHASGNDDDAACATAMAISDTIASIPVPPTSEVTVEDVESVLRELDPNDDWLSEKQARALLAKYSIVKREG